jgi:DNA-binding NarL/FixJ family response regulator
MRVNPQSIPPQSLGADEALRVVLIDDDATFRGVLRMILEQRPGVTCAGEAANAREAEELCRRVRPQFALIDRQLGVDDGVQLGERLRKAFPGLRMLLLTAFPSEDLPARLLGAGFLGYVDKDASIERVVQAVDAVAAGQFFFSSRVAPAEQSRASGPRVNHAEAARLAPRQREIATMVARGRMSKEIAAELNLSLRTVEKHRSAILRRLGLRDTASLTLWCVRAGLID